MKPAGTLKLTTSYLKNLEKAKRLSVVVGLPQGTATSKVYTTGKTVLEVGAIHEFGGDTIPQRSFLRVPFAIKRKEIEKAFLKLFNAIAEKGAKAEIQMGKAGVLLQNISKEAFTSKGYGTWPDIKQSTKNAKGSSGVLIDKGLLRGSITYEVRGE